jgi:hypothetical protein
MNEQKQRRRGRAHRRNVSHDTRPMQLWDGRRKGGAQAAVGAGAKVWVPGCSRPLMVCTITLPAWMLYW